MSDIDPTKMKVAELREELKSRGLDTKGTKAVLVKRLRDALNPESHEADTEETFDTTTEITDTSALDDSVVAHPEPEPAQEPEPEPEPVQPEPEPEPVQPEPEPVQADPEPEVQPEPEPEPIQRQPEVTALPEEETPVSNVELQETEAIPEPSVDEVMEEDAAVAPEASNGDETPAAADFSGQEKEQSEQQEYYQEQSEQNFEQEKNNQYDPEYSEEPMQEQEQEGEPDDRKNGIEMMQDDGTGQSYPDSEIKQEDDIKQEENDESRDDDSRRGRKREHSPDGRGSRSRSNDNRNKRRDRSPNTRALRKENFMKYHSFRQQQGKQMDSDDWLQLTDVLLDKYNSDLTLKIGEDGLSATPMTNEGFAFMWSGVRTTYGVVSGKVCFEVKITEHQNVNHLPAEETSRHVVRVGASCDSTSTQLGEEPKSYGFGGTGKASENCKFNNYGESFGEGDVITCCLDIESAPYTISFLKNGNDLGTAFNIEPTYLNGEALFPHILTKNCNFECNFGQKEEPYFPAPEGYVFINEVPLEQRVRGAIPPEKKEDCEMLMMCGLPGAGKSTWAEKHSQEFPDKKYNILGTNAIIDKMKVMGLPRKRNYAGRWDVLIDKSTKCLNKMFEWACRKKRNYILDQTNVYPSAQRRKMRPFSGFQRKAIVIVPTDDEFQRRCQQREKVEGKEVPDSAVLEMKANFGLPEVGQLFDEVTYIEVQQEEAVKLVQQYNEEGKAALPPQEKRFRGGGGGGGGGPERFGERFGGGRGGGGGGGYRGRFEDRGDRGRDRFGGGRDHHRERDRGYGGGGRDRFGGGDRYAPRHGGGGGGYRDGGYRDRHHGGYGGGGGGGGRDRYAHSDRGRERYGKGEYSDHRRGGGHGGHGAGGHGGSWGHQSSEYGDNYNQSTWEQGHNKGQPSTATSQQQGWGGWGNQQQGQQSTSGQWGNQNWANQQAWNQYYQNQAQQQGYNQGQWANYQNYWQNYQQQNPQQAQSQYNQWYGQYNQASTAGSTATTSSTTTQSK